MLHTFMRDSSTIVATDVSSASRSNSTSQAVSLNTAVSIGHTGNGAQNWSCTRQVGAFKLYH